MVGQKVGPFEIVAQVGTWSGGAVYKATRKTQTVAIRIYAQEDPNQRRRFLDFAQAACALSSPQIADTVGGGDLGSSVYVVQEYVQGTSLAKLLAERHGFSALEVLDIARQVSSALDHAAARGVAHPHLTPANIVIEMDGTVKVLDYGILRPGKPGGGKDPYCAPEVLAGGAADHRANLYSWAAILMHMVAGVPPGEPAEGAAEPFAGGRFDAIRPCIRQALAGDPAARPASGKELLKAMEAALAPKPTVVARPASESAPAAERVSAPGPSPLRAAVRNEPAINGAAIAPAAKAAAVVAAPPAPKPRPAVAPRVAAAAARLAPKLFGLRVGNPVQIATLALLAVFAIASFVLGYKQWFEPPLAVEADTPAPVAVVETPAPVAQPAEGPVVTVQQPAPVKRNRLVAASRPIAPRPAAPVVGTLIVNTSPAGAEVRIAGRAGNYRSPLSLNGLAPGQYLVTASVAGYRNQTQSIQVRAGQQAIMAVALSPLPLLAQVSSEPPGAAILLNGRETGKVTPAEVVLGPGPQNLSLRRAGFLEAGTNAQAQPGTPFRFHSILQYAGDAARVQSSKRLKKLFRGGAPADMGTLLVKTTPKGGQVRINGRLVDDAPSELFLPPGNYEVTLNLAGHRAERRVMRIELGVKHQVEHRFVPE